MIYSSRIKIRKQNGKLVSHKHRRKIHSLKWRKATVKKLIKNNKREKFLHALLINSTLFSFVIVIIFCSIFAYLQRITKDLPSPDKPFGNKNYASEIYDRNGNLLYRVFNEENRDVVKLDEVPPYLIWAFLSAEDVDFYDHTGVDFVAMIRCGLKNFADSSISCGGSTVTQQLIKQTALSSEQKYERKIKEVILAFQIEQLHTKDEILEMYLTVVPEGSNVYSITSAADFYFGKELKDLTLAEMTILAAIPQSPSLLSPTKSTNP